MEFFYDLYIDVDKQQAIISEQILLKKCGEGQRYRKLSDNFGRSFSFDEPRQKTVHSLQITCALCTVSCFGLVHCIMDELDWV